jgi:cytochrome P450
MGTSAANAAERLAIDFDPSSPEIWLLRPEIYGVLRSGSPRWSNACGGFWAVARHADLLEAAAHPEIFCSSGGTNIPPDGFPHKSPPNEVDPPEHQAWRKLTAPFFAPRTVAGLEGPVRDKTRALISAFRKTGSADLARECLGQMARSARSRSVSSFRSRLR